MSDKLEIPLDKNGKYVVIVRHESGKHIMDLSQLASQLKEWYNSSENFIILHPYQGVEIEFHEVKKDE